MEQDFDVTFSPQVNEIFTALSKFQGQIEAAKKDKVNPFHNSKYADLAGVVEACREPLAANGLCVAQMPIGDKDKQYLVTILGHSSGQWIKGKTPLLMNKSDSQAQGSAITYVRRYSFGAITGVVTEKDDDAEAAMPPAEERKRKENKVEPIKPCTKAEEDKITANIAANLKENVADIREYFDAFSKHKKISYREALDFYKTQEELEAAYLDRKERKKKAA